jgi:hypothetical protein
VSGLGEKRTWRQTFLYGDVITEKAGRDRRTDYSLQPHSITSLFFLSHLSSTKELDHTRARVYSWSFNDHCPNVVDIHESWELVHPCGPHCPSTVIVLEQQIKRELKRIHVSGCRWNERLKAHTRWIFKYTSHTHGRWSYQIHFVYYESIK